ncbi:MAG: hypothetical protein H5T76_35050 [Streptomyces sp.]|nr:hypothetical protein [Streptomyces sp.]
MWTHRRPRGRDERTAPRDTTYGFLSLDEGAYFRSQVREAFAERGLEVTIHATEVSDSAGRHFALTDLAAVCHHDAGGRGRWPRVIRDHVDRVLRVADGPSPLDSLPHEELLTRLRPWVVTPGVLTPDDATPMAHTHARVVAPGLCEVLALDLPESVMPLTDEALSSLGDLVDLRRRALANLRALPLETHSILHGPDGIRFHVLTGESFFTSSRALTADQLTRDLTGHDLGPAGALISMPNRYTLALSPITTATPLLPTLHGMTAFTTANHTHAVGPVTPDVYWWHHGILTRLVHHHTGEPHLTRPAEFDLLLMRLTDDDAGEHP